MIVFMFKGVLFIAYSLGMYYLGATLHKDTSKEKEDRIKNLETTVQHYKRLIGFYEKEYNKQTKNE